MRPIHWTPRLVAAFLEEAACVQREGRVDGFRAGPERHASVPTPEAIDQMHWVVGWLGSLNAVDADIVWKRAQCVSWKTIGYENTLDRITAWRRWTQALFKIATALNVSSFATPTQHQPE